MRHPQSETDQKNLITPLRGGTIFRFEIVLYTWAIVETSDLQGEQTKSNWYTHQEPGRIHRRPVGITTDQIQRQQSGRTDRNRQGQGAGSGGTGWTNTDSDVQQSSEVVFRLKFLYCQKPGRGQEHNGSSDMRGE